MVQLNLKLVVLVGIGLANQVTFPFVRNAVKVATRAVSPVMTRSAGIKATQAVLVNAPKANSSVRNYMVLATGVVAATASGVAQCAAWTSPTVEEIANRSFLEKAFCCVIKDDSNTVESLASLLNAELLIKEFYRELKKRPELQQKYAEVDSQGVAADRQVAELISSKLAKGMKAAGKAKAYKARQLFELFNSVGRPTFLGKLLNCDDLERASDLMRPVCIEGLKQHLAFKQLERSNKN